MAGDYYADYYFDVEDRPILLPFYLVVDVSASMRRGEPGETPWDHLRSSLADLQSRLEQEPAVRDSGALGLIAFGETAHVLLALSPVAAGPGLPSLPLMTATDYAAAFRLLHHEMRRDYLRLAPTHVLKRPVVFFLSDGLPGEDGKIQPKHEWGPAVSAVKDGEGGGFRPPIVVALGFGAADASVLRFVATDENAFLADPGTVGRRLISSIVRAIRDSIVNTATRSFRFDTPVGMRRL